MLFKVAVMSTLLITQLALQDLRTQVQDLRMDVKRLVHKNGQ